MITFSEPYLTGNEQAYIAEVFARRDFGGNGSFTKRCSQILEKRFGVQRVLLTHSCTAALEMAAILCDLGPGDEAIVPSYTFCTTASAVLRTGAKVVFCEIDPKTQMLDVDDVERRLSDRTRAIIPVHYGGMVADLGKLAPLAAANGIPIIEDAAQSVGCSLNGKSLGTFGRFGCVSFHHTKNIHAGLAGAIFINDERDIDAATCVWERGTNRQQFVDGTVDKYTWVSLGSSFYPTELQAAMLLAQLEGLDANTSHRFKIVKAYREGLRDVEKNGEILLPHLPADFVTNYHAFSVIFPNAESREIARRALLQQGIQAQFHYVPLHSSPMGRKLGYEESDLPITEAIASRALRLPLHTSMTVEDASRIAESLSKIVQR